MIRFKLPDYRFITTVGLLLMCLSCAQQQQESPEAFLQSLPHEHPQEINRFQHADSVYFSHLGYETIPLDGGSVLVYDRDNPVLAKVSPEGDLIHQFARSGRGPGEIQDILSVASISNDKIVVYDQGNRKLIQFDTEGSFINELMLPKFDEGQATAIYPSPDSLQHLIRFDSYRFLTDKSVDPYFSLVQYNTSDDNYEASQKFKERRYARLIVDGDLRGAREVPYAPNHLIAKSSGEESFYSYWTGSAQIAERSQDYDTVRTISVDLPAQKLSSGERDSLRKKFDPAQWRTLSPKLPDEKIPVEKMKLGPGGQFWLKLNYRANSDLWLIMDEEGTPQKIVHLPRGSLLTHISGNHLGVRINDVTLAFYENVN